MSDFDYLSIPFFLCCIMVLIPCEGKIILPPDGERFILKPGSNQTIQWSFDDNITKVDTRGWTFTRSGGSEAEAEKIALIFKSESFEVETKWRSKAKIIKPATLVLINVDRHFNGTYEFALSAPRSTVSAVTVFIAEKPTVTINCSSTVTVDEGDDVVCTCIGEGGNPPGDVYVSWYYNGRSIGETRKEIQILIRRNVMGTYNGTYTCEAQSHNLTDNKSIEVIVMFRPTITSFITDPTKAVVGQPVTIICVASAHPEPRYTIIHNGTRIISTSNTYYIPKAGWNDTGTYTCNATNALGNDLKFLNLTVGQLSTTFSTTKARDRTVGTHTNGHKKERGLGVFAIVGIVVGVLALVVIIIGVIYWFKFRCKEKNHEEEGNADAPLKKRRADANVYDAVATGGDDGEASTSTAPHEYATLEQVRSPHCADTQDL